MRLTLIALVVLASLGFTTFAVQDAPAPAREAETYGIDPGHSSVLFKVKHNNAAWFYGRFDTLSGGFTVDADEPSNSSVEIEVDAASVNTRSEKLDGHLRSADFFDTEKYPTIRFASTAVEAGEGEDVYSITGDLTLLDVTRSVTVEAELVGMAESRRGKVAGFHCVFRIDRTEFGMEYGAGGPLGSEVELIVSTEARRR